MELQHTEVRGEKVVFVNVALIPRKAREMMVGALEGVGLCTRKLHLHRLDPAVAQSLQEVIEHARDSHPITYTVAYDLAWRIMYGRIVRVSGRRGGNRSSPLYIKQLMNERRKYLHSLVLPREIREETENILSKFEQWKAGYRPGRRPGTDCVKK
jgi:hypothetical protein